MIVDHVQLLSEIRTAFAAFYPQGVSNNFDRLIEQFREGNPSREAVETAISIYKDGIRTLSAKSAPKEVVYDLAIALRDFQSRP